MRSKRPPPSTRCPRCGFSFAWDGRKCGHCPSPSRARRLWEQIKRFPELVGSNKGIAQGQLLAIALACLRRIGEHLSPEAQAPLEALERDPVAFARRWRPQRYQRLDTWQPALLFENALQLLAAAIRERGGFDAATVHAVTYQLSLAAGGHAAPEGESGQRRSRSTRRRNAAIRREETAQCQIARDVLGFPEVQVRYDPNWSTSTAVAIAREINETRDFSAMAILADALQDAGCNEPEILEHCRAKKPHVRGCWACSLVLSGPARPGA